MGEEFSVNARVEYIEGFSGHADQEGLLKFVSSFNEKMPKNIFLVHGETDSKETLKEKILEQTHNVDVTIPVYGQEFTLDNEVEVVQRYTNPAKKDIDKIELLERIKELELEIKEMKDTIREDIIISTSSDEDIAKLNNKVNDLRKHIIGLMNKK